MYEMRSHGREMTEEGLIEHHTLRTKDEKIVAYIMDLYPDGKSGVTDIIHVDGRKIYHGPFLFHTECNVKVIEFERGN